MTRAAWRSSRSLRSLALAGVLGAVGASSVGACGAMRRGKAEARHPPAEVEFANQSLNQADVFAVSRAGGQTRIGTVMAGRTEVLRIQGAVVAADQTVNIVARIRASSRTLSTGMLGLAPGDRIRVTLPIDERMLMALPARDP